MASAAWPCSRDDAVVANIVSLGPPCVRWSVVNDASFCCPSCETGEDRSWKGGRMKKSRLDYFDSNSWDQAK